MARLVYRLAGQKRSNPTESGYYASGSKNGSQMDTYKPMPFSRSLPRWHRIVEIVNGKKKPRQIGYSPTEDTIYLDEMREPEKLMKPKFRNGILLVDNDKDPLLEEMLDKLDINGSNPDRDKTSKVIFTKMNKEASAAAELDKKEKISKNLSVFWELPDNKLQAIANSSGISTNRPTNVWKHNLYNWASSNVKEFNDLCNDPDVRTVDLISRAENTSVLIFEVHEWKYKGNKILTVSPQKNRYTELVKRLVNDPALLTSITNDVAIIDGSEELVLKSGEKINVAKISAEDLLELAIKEEVVSYKHGYGYELVKDGTLISGKSRDSMLEKFRYDTPVKRSVVEALIKQ